MTYALVDAARTQIIKIGARPNWLVDGELERILFNLGHTLLP